MRLVTIIFLLIPFIMFADVINIPADYMTIQEGINNAAQGDMVLISPGTYYENIDLSNKIGITLCSLEATTGDSTYINTTIIDGRFEEESTILCFENVIDCTIRGLSITGGRGHIFYDIHDINSFIVYGGGIYLYDQIDLTLINLEIYGNRASQGGGIFFGQNSVCNLSKVNIYNNIGRFVGGGICFASTSTENATIVFDQQNRCSIYNNNSPQGMDIGWYFNRFHTQEIYLDMFTWYEPSKYYVNVFDYDYNDLPNPFPVFDFQRTYITPVMNDLYVSMNGDDTNTGLTSQEPLRTTWKAFQKIFATESNPRTVHLMEGDFIEEVNGFNTSIVLKENTTLQGASPEQTHIYAEDFVNSPLSTAISFASHQSNMTIRDLSLTTENAQAIGGYTPYNAEIDNVVIEDCTNSDQNALINVWNSDRDIIDGDISVKNTIIRNNVTNKTIAFYISTYDIIVDNVLIQNNTALQHETEMSTYGVYFIKALNETVIKNSTFINNEYHANEDVALFNHYYGDPSPKIL
ncbi:MAG: hypothetical protein JXR56_04240, partial [Candidatus Cloacimonetes bacterium]|nr:hypothetical protein [Candidatus Cloacimonadota bacterium]